VYFLRIVTKEIYNRAVHNWLRHHAAGLVAAEVGGPRVGCVARARLVAPRPLDPRLLGEVATGHDGRERRSQPPYLFCTENVFCAKTPMQYTCARGEDTPARGHLEDVRTAEGVALQVDRDLVHPGRRVGLGAARRRVA
jgi:hypothetical protein